MEIVTSARKHFEAFRRYSRRNIAETVFYEFGAGWDLIIPISFYAFGVERQTLVDKRKLLRFELVNDTVGRFQRLQHELHISRFPDKCFEEGSKSDRVFLLEKWYGIKYLAPCDARKTELRGASIDFITSTNTLEHISAHDVRLILEECHRLLKDDGLMSLTIDYQDHYSYFDSQISVYNFLQYSPAAWKLYNSSLHFQNRIRHREYLDLINRSGFVVEEENLIEGSNEDLEILRRFALAPTFRELYTPAELAIRGGDLVLRKQTRGVTS
ncbi:class I SAM-dependent methyltransferase [Acidobacteriia bacterium AH_259_A11_L15]|nr:class I SAM-dependent methyltransferase [Acidobacteriia bacterium AH_259_A11_L15]